MVSKAGRRYAWQPSTVARAGRRIGDASHGGQTLRGHRCGPHWFADKQKSLQIMEKSLNLTESHRQIVIPFRFRLVSTTKALDN